MSISGLEDRWSCFVVLCYENKAKIGKTIRELKEAEEQSI